MLTIKPKEEIAIKEYLDGEVFTNIKHNILTSLEKFDRADAFLDLETIFREQADKYAKKATHQTRYIK